MELIRAELVVCKALVNQTRAEFAAARAAFVDLRLDDNAEQPWHSCNAASVESRSKDLR